MAGSCTAVDVSTGSPVEVQFDNLIVAVEPLLAPATATSYVAPGFIDLQVNGFAGADYCSPETPVEAIGRSLDAQFATGVTRLLATVITNSPEAMLGAIRNLTRAKSELGARGAAIEGLHIEGPHISPDDGPRGAHPRQFVRPPDFDEFRRWQEAADGCVKLTTVAPEQPGALDYIERVASEGVAVSIGHTGATPEQIRDAVAAGARMSTHLGNAAHASLPRWNYIWAQLGEDRLAASFIADGVHLRPEILRTLLRAKGAERSILVTDAVAPAGREPGRYRLGEVEVELHADQRVTTAAGDRLAGSALTMQRAVENVIRWTGASLAEALVMATRNPARSGRIGSRQRGLQPGDRADLVQFTFDADGGRIGIERVWMGGDCVFHQ